MLTVPSSVRIYLHTGPTDMRKGIDGLSGIVRGEFGDDPLSGSLYLFVNRRANRLKILHWDGTGFWVYYRVLERGTFEVPRSDDARVQIDATQLAMILGGVSLAGVTRRKRYAHAS
ncbi:MAG: IS66 family insertion sequence element accessory protein TnpB [Pirellulales bacterium]|nr:IS66 family insertion sequence element accessory protein TnpB [Pirellulales bacterium]